MKALAGYLVRKLGECRGKRRLWLEGQFLAKGDFQPGSRFDVEPTATCLTLRRADQGCRLVSSRERHGKVLPIIDISNDVIAQVFGAASDVVVIIGDGEIVVRLRASERAANSRVNRLLAKLANGQALSVGSVSHGGGVLSLALHRGFAEGGIATRLAFANEIRDDLAAQAESVNPVWQSTVALVAPMQELAFDPEAMALLEEVDVLEAGIPCQGASLSGRAKNAIAKPEDHPEVGHLIAAFIAILARVNPAVLVFENVPPYQSSASAAILRTTLRERGYEVQESVLDGEAFNALEHRKRYCLVAVSKGLQVSPIDLQMPGKQARTLGEILEHVPDESDAWKDVPYLHAKQIRDEASGKGFAMQLVDAQSTGVGTIGKGYAKWRSTEPLVKGNPTYPNKLRLLTPAEHAAVKGIPPVLVEGLPATTAHELLGQSVLYEPFRVLGKAIACALKGVRQTAVTEIPATSRISRPSANLDLFEGAA